MREKNKQITHLINTIFLGIPISGMKYQLKEYFQRIASRINIIIIKHKNILFYSLF